MRAPSFCLLHVNFFPVLNLRAADSVLPAREIEQRILHQLRMGFLDLLLAEGLARLPQPPDLFDDVKDAHVRVHRAITCLPSEVVLRY